MLLVALQESVFHMLQGLAQNRQWINATWKERQGQMFHGRRIMQWKEDQ